jgi:hypothetical protein
MIYQDYDRKGSVAKKKKKTGSVPQGAWCQVELIGGKMPVVNYL